MITEFVRYGRARQASSSSTDQGPLDAASLADNATNMGAVDGVTSRAGKASCSRVTVVQLWLYSAGATDSR